MFVFSHWKQKAAEADTEIQRLKQQLLLLEASKRWWLAQHRANFMEAKLYRKKHSDG